MMLNDGVFNGKRYLSEKAVEQIRTKETGASVTKQYGFGWDVAADSYQHGGAYKTNMKVAKKLGIITVFLVQRADGWRRDDGEKIMNSIQQVTQTIGRSVERLN
jgi:CubicO group peptidase (beta-lactamase class C family)